MLDALGSVVEGSGAVVAANGRYVEVLVRSEQYISLGVSHIPPEPYLC